MMRRAWMLSVLLMAASCSKDKSANEEPNRSAAAPRPQSVNRAEQWRRDVRHLADTLAAKHVDAFSRVSKADFAAAAEALAKRAATLDDNALVMEMQRLVAMIGDGHTMLDVNAVPVLPLRLYWFDDGFHVVGIDAAHEAAMNKRVLAIGKVPIDELAKKVAAYISHDNRAGLRLQAPRFLTMPALLSRLSAAAPDGKTTVTLADRTSQQSTITLVPPRGAVPWAHSHRPVPLRGRKSHLSYWNEPLPEHNAVYMKYNRCAEMKAHPFARFAAGMLGYIDQNKISRVIIDLRGNQGGNSMLFRPLLEGLVARSKLRVLAIIDRAVFSSALINAIELQQRARATLVGEPTSGKPNHFGEVKTFQLPHSGLRVSYSTKRFRMVDGDPPSLVPDIEVPVTASVLLAGEDPALDAALAAK